MNVRKIVASLTLLPAVAIAGLDRGGNVLLEDDGGGSGNLDAGPAVLLLACIGISTYVLYKALEARTGYSSAANFNIAWLVATVGAALLMALLK